MEQPYPTLLQMPIALRAEGKGEEYVVSVPAYACKEDLKQVVEDGMLICIATLSSRQSWYVLDCCALFYYYFQAIALF